MIKNTTLTINQKPFKGQTFYKDLSSKENDNIPMINIKITSSPFSPLHVSHELSPNEIENYRIIEDYNTSH